MRKKKILELLSQETKPIRGEDLASLLGVTRQVIVQDIAILRAEGQDIISTNRGYIITRNNNRLEKRLVCKHFNNQEMMEELNIIVDYGASIKDVIIDHPVYGELRAALELNNRKDVRDFIDSIERKEAKPLARLTNGVHIHTIEVDSQDMFLDIKSALARKNYLTK